MGKVQAKKFGEMKKMLKLTDIRIKKEERAKKRRRRKKGPKDGAEGEEGGSSRMKIQSLPQSRSSMFFTYNTNLGPPFHVLVDTNFINFSIQNKLDIWQSMMDCLYAKCIPYISDCVMAEIEKLGPKFKVALRIAKDSRFERLPCLHKGTYADDCITQRVTQHKCYIVATCDKDLRRRIRKIPGVPIMYLKDRRYTIERMPDAYGAPKE